MSKCIFKNLGISLEVKMKDVPRVFRAPAPASQLSTLLSSVYFVSCVTLVTPCLSPGHCCLSLIATTRGPGK